MKSENIVRTDCEQTGNISAAFLFERGECDILKAHSSKTGLSTAKEAAADGVSIRIQAI